jgi:hypothetical protein
MPSITTCAHVLQPFITTIRERLVRIMQLKVQILLIVHVFFNVYE